MPAPLAYDAAAVVLVGNFNPAIFQPAWFSAQNLLSSDAVAAARAGQLVVTPEVTGFSAGWVEVQVTPERFQAVTLDPTSFLPLRDLVLGTFIVLEHTPVKNMGFNRICHFPTGEEGRWHRLGDVLAPKEPWRDFFSGHIGLRSITLEGLPAAPAGSEDSRTAKAPPPSSPIPEGPLKRRLRIKLEPSVRVEFGVFVEVNQHYTSPDPESNPLPELLTALRSEWSGWLDHSLASVNHLYDYERGLG